MSTNESRFGHLPKPRKIGFEFPDDLDPRWIPNNPEFTAMVNGASLTMPYLEPFLIRSMRDALKALSSDEVAEHARAFNTQEQFHYQTHRRFNELLKSKRYPELAKIEESMKESYMRLSAKPLQKRMAYTAGFESMTLGVTKWLVENRVELFAGADSRVVSFVLWHMVEETEHKCVAFDVYQELYGHSPRAYWHRMIGVFHGSLDVIRFSMRGYKSMLKKDGLWSNLKSRLRLASEITRFVTHVGPYLLRAAMPGHNPRQEKDPEWVQQWLAGHEQQADDFIPLVDTHDPQMPVPYPQTAPNLERAA